MDKIISCHFRNFLSISILCSILVAACFSPINSYGQSGQFIEKELTQYTLSPSFERIIQQFIQEGEKTFYKAGQVLMTVGFNNYGITISGDTAGRWRNMCMFSSSILGCFTVSGHDFIIYGPSKYIENICFRGHEKRKFKMWEAFEPIFEDPNISYIIIQGKDGQFRITEKYYDPDVR